MKYIEVKINMSVKTYKVKDGIWIRETDEEGELIREFFIAKKEEKKQHTTSQSEGSWEPRYSDDEEEEDNKVKKYKYSRTKCMGCRKKAPEVEVLWAEGMAHAWFCKVCYKKWKKKTFTIVGNKVTYGEDVVNERAIDGEASKSWSDKVNKVTFEGHEGKWVTLEGGQKVFIREGESLDQALDRVKPTPKISISVDENHVEFAMGEKGKIGNADIFLHSRSLAREEKGSAYLDIVDIKEDYRRKGYGTKLVYRVESYAKKHGIKMIYINSTHDSVDFWDKLGYKPYGKKPEDPIKVREIWNLNRRKKIA